MVRGLNRSHRREFLKRAGGAAAALAAGAAWPLFAGGGEERAAAAGVIPPLTLISGSPRERGRQYGRQFADGIRGFLDREIYGALIQKTTTKEAMLAYAGACGKEVKQYTPEIHDELEGIAEGSGLRLEEALLITLHEELYHRGALPKVEHCTAVAVGPPETSDGNTYVGQTWDWMESVFGLSSMLHWQRQSGPSLLAYSFPGLWVGAGLNSAGLALCWTSASLGDHSLGARVGIPAYVLLAHLLYQESLDAVEQEAKRAKNAGWFTFVLADADGGLCNVEGSPAELAVERSTGRMARISFGSRQMTKTPAGTEVARHPRCDKMLSLLGDGSGRLTRKSLQHFFEEPSCGISVGRSTIDMMVYNTTAREAWLSRGPSYGPDWKRFTFEVAARTS